MLNLKVNSDLISSTINDVRLRATSASSTHSFVEKPQRPQSSIGFFNQSNWNSSTPSSVSTYSHNSNNYSSPSTGRTQSPRPRRQGIFYKKFWYTIIWKFKRHLFLSIHQHARKVLQQGLTDESHLQGLNPHAPNRFTLHAPVAQNIADHRWLKIGTFFT